LEELVLGFLYWSASHPTQMMGVRSSIQDVDGITAEEETSLSEALEDVGLLEDEGGEVQQLHRLTKKQRELVSAN
jgi:hypothetical protein